MLIQPQDDFRRVVRSFEVSPSTTVGGTIHELLEAICNSFKTKERETKA